MSENSSDLMNIKRSSEKLSGKSETKKASNSRKVLKLRIAKLSNADCFRTPQQVKSVKEALLHRSPVRLCERRYTDIHQYSMLTNFYLLF